MYTSVAAAAVLLLGLRCTAMGVLQLRLCVELRLSYHSL